MKYPISACIIGKNEEQHIEKCLSPLKELGLEIVYTDTGSADATISIAKRFTDKIYHFEWCDDFSAARNFCISKAGNDIILNIDCDEYLMGTIPENMQYLTAILNVLDEKPELTGNIVQNNKTRDNLGNIHSSPVSVARLFHRGHHYFEYPIHEQVMPLSETFDTNLWVDHSGYMGAEDFLYEKGARDLKILLREYDKGNHSDYILFQIGQSYRIMGQLSDAADYYSRMYETHPDRSLEYVREGLLALSDCLMKTGNHQRALALLLELRDNYGHLADYHCQLGMAWLYNDEIKNGMLSFVQAIGCRETIAEGCNTYVPYYNLGYVFEELGEIEKARENYRKCGDYPPAVEKLNNI